MKVIFKNIFILILMLVFLAGAAVPCFAAEEGGRITVLLEDGQKNKISGIEAHICRIAEWDADEYRPVEAFKDSGISISGALQSPDEAAKDILDYVKKKGIESRSAVSDQGRILFSDLDPGLWLVYCDESSEYTFNPYLVLLSRETKNGGGSAVVSSPKTDVNTPEKINIYVIKKWDDENNASGKRPESVIIELLKGDEAAASVELSETNGWAHTFYNLPKDGVYSVREQPVEDYTVAYSGDSSNGFIVTNTYKEGAHGEETDPDDTNGESGDPDDTNGGNADAGDTDTGKKLPQTGLYWWPVPVIALAGICFVLLGITEMGEKKNDRKTK